jgi:SAM-dependent methyltransferase
MNALDNEITPYVDETQHALDNRLMLNWYAGRILKMAEMDSMLELGLGHGITASRFAGKFRRYVVLEGSDKVIQRFKDVYSTEAQKIEIIKTFFETFQPIETFQNILMGFVLEHVDDPKLILDQFKPLLQTDGSLFVAVPNAEALNRRYGYEAGLLADMTELSDFDRASGHKRNWGIARWQELVKSCGYVIEQCEGLFLKPVTTQQLLALNLPESVLQAMCKVGVDYPELCLGILMKCKRTP